jgi:hypothetical protein
MIKKQEEIDIEDLFEITYESMEFDEVDEVEVDEVDDDFVISKHKMTGKHSLKYDTIFKGKKDDDISEDDPQMDITYQNDSFEIDRSSILYEEYRDTEQYNREKKVKEKVYNILADKTSINFMNNRRKPSRGDFNNYYHLLVTELVNERFSNIELFNELAVYFSDNLFNMFKLLDNKWRTKIIDELQDHIGKNANMTDITNRNLREGTEIEFIYVDLMGEKKIYTGVIFGCDYDNQEFRVNSYENTYDITISDISKILKNDFKFNLNKLNNIDFL